MPADIADIMIRLTTRIGPIVMGSNNSRNMVIVVSSSTWRRPINFRSLTHSSLEALSQIARLCEYFREGLLLPPLGLSNRPRIPQRGDFGGAKPPVPERTLEVNAA